MLPSFYSDYPFEAGCDEAGRGCLAGPVFAAAVILPKHFEDPLLNDSKQIAEKTRDYLRETIEKNALAWAVAMLPNQEIDAINILNASIKAMHLALEKLHISPNFILVDGNRFKPYKNIPYKCIVKGDSKFASIAAASILAKTHRDEYMKNLHSLFPQYNWKKNKAYPTREHREAILKYGVSPHHRLSFKLTEDQLSIPF